MISSTRFKIPAAGTPPGPSWPLLVCSVRAWLTKANAAALPVGTGVGGHHQNGVFKIHHTALGVGDPAVVQHLQEHIQHIGMGLFNLVKQNHA